MAEFFVMPQASPTMTAGTLLSWKKKEGDSLASQDILAEVETDKAAMDIEVFDATTLLKILAVAGEEVPAGAPIAILGKPGEDITGLLADFEAKKAAASTTPKAVAATAPPSVNKDPQPRVDGAPEQVEAPSAAPSASRTASPTVSGLVRPTWGGRPLPAAIMEVPTSWSPAAPRLRASPLARKLATELGVPLARVRGSGPHGRIVRADVEGAKAAPSTRAQVATADSTVRNTQMRKTIARRLTQVWHEAPSFYLTAVFDADRLVDFRTQLKEAGIVLSYNDLIVKATALALRDMPACNASWGDDAILRHGGVHIGVAVALDEGLITPVLRDADQKSVEELSAEIRELAKRARDRKLQPEEYTGSTFSVSNLGMMGIEQFTAILNPPEAGILAVGAMKKEAVVEKDAIVVRTLLRVTMTCDHRVIDGALGAKFLERVRHYIEKPVLMR